MTQPWVIRDAVRDDLPQILGIYNEVIRTSTAVYSEVELTDERGEAWYAAKAGRGYPFVVAAAGEAVLGFASFAEFRPWPCYEFTVEHSVHVRSDRRGSGIGRALVSEMIVRARALQKHVLIAGIDADNAASIALHERLGFRQVGHFHQVGFKFGRWLDLRFLQLTL